MLPILSHIPHHLIPLPLRLLRRPDLGADVMCLGALALAVAGMLTRRARSALGYAALWYSYLSMQALLGHDPPLLFEVGFVAILLGSGRSAAAVAAAPSAVTDALCVPPEPLPALAPLANRRICRTPLFQLQRYLSSGLHLRSLGALPPALRRGHREAPRWRSILVGPDRHQPPLPVAVAAGEEHKRSPPQLGFHGVV